MTGANKTKTNLFLDIGIFLALILAMAPRATGLPVHEWLSIAFAGTIIAHILLHWDWIVGLAPRFFARLFHESRLNFVVDLLFFLALLVVMVSGLALSKVALPALGLSIPFSILWKEAHGLSALVAVVTLGIHCGLHVTWIACNGKRFLIDPVSRLLGKKPDATIALEGK